MKLDISSLTGVLILAGHLDPCANIGTEGHFDLLPIPWDKYMFEEKVSYMIHCELALEENIKFQKSRPPYSEGDSIAVLREAGLRAWMVQKRYMHNIIPIMHKWNKKIGILNKEYISKITLNVYPFIYRWPDKNDINTNAIKKFELMLISHL